MLIVSPKDDGGGSRHGLHSLDGGVHIGALAVINVANTFQLPDKLNPVLHALEGLQGMPKHLCGNAHSTCYAHSCQSVLQIVRPWDINFVRSTHNLFLPVQPQHHFAIPCKGTFRHLMLSGEKEHVAFHLRNQRLQGRIIVIKDCIILLGLLLENPHLHGGIGCHVPMPVQVILGDVQQCRHLGMKGICRFHLKRGNLTDNHIVLLAA